MKTSVGWALSGMWYDRFQGLPPRGSLLESIFLLVFLSRQEAHLLATRAIVQSTLPEGSAAKPAIEAYQKYCDRMFPHIERAGDMDKEQQRERLAAFVKKKATISLAPVLKAQADQQKKIAAFKQFRLKPRYPGT
jgi:hypothetical protein